MIIIRFVRTLRFSRELFQSIRHQSMAPLYGSEDASKFVEDVLEKHKVVVFSKTYCPFCTKVKDLFTLKRVEFKVVELDQLGDPGPAGDAGGMGSAIQLELDKKTQMKTVPNVFINKIHVGGCDATLKADRSGKLELLFKGIPIEYDLIVVGGGSGGLSAAKEAKKLGMKVALLDFVTPSPIGTKWGLGGTCVNVGCIPKKLMHKAAILGEDMGDAPCFGWEISQGAHNWTTMVEAVSNYIKSLNFKYRSSLLEKEISYINALGRFDGPYKLKLTDVRGKESDIYGHKIIIAVGGRPMYPNIPGAKEYGITSDDLFSLKYHPGKVLLVGASYIALECAGFLNALGVSTTVMVRSILLRGFDQQIADMIGVHMESHGVKFVRGCVPSMLTQVSTGPVDDKGKACGPALIKVSGVYTSGELFEDHYNTVIFAIGRQATTDALNLESVNVEVNPRNKKIRVNEAETTTHPDICAIGDVIDGQLELTPVAIQAGKLLARRLFGDSEVLMDYQNVPTTVFTPLEYGCVGLSEEEAKEKFGDEGVEVYHTHFQPLEYELSDRDKNRCYSKIVCLKNESERVVGFHTLSPNAGEITQGFALAIKIGATKNDFANLVGIHPTCAEWFTVIDISKSSGLPVTDASC